MTPAPEQLPSSDPAANTGTSAVADSGVGSVAVSPSLGGGVVVSVTGSEAPVVGASGSGAAPAGTDPTPAATSGSAGTVNVVIAAPPAKSKSQLPATGVNGATPWAFGLGVLFVLAGAGLLAITLRNRRGARRRRA
ncbi:MAG: hypothetical protein LBQ06_04775 [Frankiaceae bacterium]|nr:hypothetical protein [Frankiaceae bacterium]